jgi:MFS family permease
MLAWLRDLTSRERRTMLACWGGWTLDGFDQQLYSYVVPTIIAVWGMSTGAAGTIGTVTVVTSSFGGWFAGALADRFGREGQKPGNMIAYSPEQIISRADAAGQAAYAAVIRAGGAAGVAERAYSRAYLGTIPPCWVALLASPIQPRRPKSGDGGIGVHAHGRVSGQSAVESAA